MSTEQMKLFVPLKKVDAEKRLVYGIITQEIVDKSGEIMDYESAKPNFMAWSEGISKATNGQSLGNLRSMHQPVAAGKFVDIQYDDASKSISACAKVVDDVEWGKVLEGVYTGFSIGGSYQKRWGDPSNAKLTRFTPMPTEVSLVDNPCVPSATFSMIKSDGSIEERPFKAAPPPAEELRVEQVWKAADGTCYPRKQDAVERNQEIAAGRLISKTVSGVDKLLGDLTKGMGETSVLPTLAKGMYDVSRLACMLDDLRWMKEGFEYPGVDQTNAEPMKVKVVEAASALMEVITMMLDAFKESMGTETSAEKSADPKASYHRFLKAIKAVAKDGKAAQARIILASSRVAKEGEPTDQVAALKEKIQQAAALMNEVMEITGIEPASSEAPPKEEEASPAQESKMEEGKDEAPAPEGEASDEKPAEKVAEEEAQKTAPDVLRKLAEQEAENQGLKKFITKTEGVLKKVAERVLAQESLIKTQEERIKALETQPLPPKGVVRAMDKGTEGGQGGPTNDSLANQLAKMSPDEVNKALMKAALSRPITGNLPPA